MGRIAAGVGLSVLMLFASLARADDSREQARRHFERGKQEFAAVHYERALEEFKAAYAIAPFPEMLYNIARCEEELRHNRAAIETYERYMAVSTSAIEREELAQRIERLRHDPERPALDAVLVQAPAPSPSRRPLYRRWWLWTIVGGVAAASLAVGLGVGLGTSSAPSAAAFPPLTVQPR